MLNSQSLTNVTKARTGKDGVLLDENSKILASVESFTSNVTYNNVAYSVLGNAQELETPNTFKVVLTLAQVVIESDKMITDLIDAMTTQKMPSWTFHGKLDFGDSIEQITYSECIPSGQIDLQNLAVGDVIKRNWNFIVNKPPTFTTVAGSATPPATTP